MVRLPAEYQEVEYLESSGTQWINTGIPLNTIADERTNWNLRFSPTSLSKVQILCGANESEKQVVLLSSGVIRKDWAIPGRTGFSKILLVGGIYLISQTDGLFKLQSTEEDAETEQIARTTSSNYPFALFAKTTNENGTAVENSTIAFMKLYSFNAFNGDSDICNFVPCYRKSDSEPGMYDTVSGTFFTNAGTGTFLVGNDVSWDTASLIERRRQILLNTPHLETISDSIASFKTDVPALVKDCKVYFTPVQEGSSDPSPDNVRPITGWNGVTVYKTGKNLVDKSKYYNLPSEYEYVDSSYKCKEIQLLPNTAYTLTCNSDTAASSPIILMHKYSHVNTAGFLDLRKVTDTKTLTTDSTGKLYIGTIATANAVSVFNARLEAINVQIELGTQATDYEPYTGTSITISFQPTIYGGYVDLVKGEVVEEWSQIASYNGETLPGEWISDRDVYTAGTGPTIGAQVAYKLVAPITHQLTPETVKILKGVNNIWSNTNDNIEVKFWKH